MTDTPSSGETLLSSPVEKLAHVGTRNLARLKRLGIATVRDLLWHLPVRYEDYSAVTPIDSIQPGEKVNIQGEVVKISTRRIFSAGRRFGGSSRFGLTITDAIIQDQSGAIKAVWFNQPYVENSLIEGSMVSLAGKVTENKRYGTYLASPTYEKITTDSGGEAVHELRHTAGLVPIYPETEGVTSKYLRFLIKPVLDQLELPDPLPVSLLKKYGFMDLVEAVRTIHYPKKADDATEAKERLAFDDLLLFQLKALLERRKMNQLKSTALPFQQDLIVSFIDTLPFTLTQDQKVAAWEILKDLQRPFPMNRLLEGDVGSGKTVVALIAAVQAAAHNHQTAFMAPTEVLAVQHNNTIVQLVKGRAINVGLLTGSEAQLNGTPITKPELKKKIASGDVGIVIGTHAVIQKDVRFSRLAVVVIDEQHRFGVSQRFALVRGSSEEVIPHLLSMTATPIPRTLALTIFGDLDISIIKEKPKNRQPIITRLVSPLDRKASYEFIHKQVKAGRQVFVICPRIAASENGGGPRPAGAGSQFKPLSQSKLVWSEVKAVEEEYARLSKEIFPDLKVAMLHGKMKPKDKQQIMHEFKNGWHDILVSTSVIEVGVDVPNASIMMIESAERFGLAQLHQFRGRVGRDSHQSYCFLFTSGDTGSSSRLNALVKSDDGFVLAEKDMAIRGPGEFFGTKQSGLADLAMAALANVELIKKSRLEARLMLKEDPSLKKHPLLAQRLDEFQKITHFE